MARHVAPSAALHDVANGARRARLACQRGDIPVRRHAAGRNAPDGVEDAIRERIGLRHFASAWVSARPSTFAIVAPASAASVGAISAGVTESLYRPGLMPFP